MTGPPPPPRGPGRPGATRRRLAVYLGAFGALTLIYAVTTGLLYATRDWSDRGPLSFRSAPTAEPLPGGLSRDEALDACTGSGSFDPEDRDDVTVRAVELEGRTYVACYDVRRGDVFEATVVDESGQDAPTDVVKRQGAWPWIGTVKHPSEIVLGTLGVVVIGGLYFLYYRRHRPGPPVPARWWEGTLASAVLGATCLLPLTLPFRRQESRARRVRLMFLWVLGVSATVAVGLTFDSLDDVLSGVATGLLVAALLLGWGLGRRLAPPGFGRPEPRAAYAAAYDPGGLPNPYRPAPPPLAAYPPPAYPASPYSATPYAPTPPPAPAAAPVAPQQPASAVPAPRPAVAAADRRPVSRFRVTRAGDLPTFADVGGMMALQDELSDTLGLLLAFTGEAEQYRISFNGILLHGPPGVGKTFMAQATAGEFGMSFLAVSTGDLVSKYVGESARNIQAVFAEAARNVPCILFFDEFDSIAERRDDGISEESKRVVNQLLQSLEQWRRTSGLVVLAATNHLDRLDPAVVRPGRFDRHVRVDLPDLAARTAMLESQLAGRPVDPKVDLVDLAERLAGRTPAVIARVANAAAMTAFRASTETGVPVPISQHMLRDALDGLGGTDRPTVEDWTWDRLVLHQETVAELQQVQWLVKDPDLAKRYGVQPPSGLLLTGPPGTGKTTIARVFAAEAGCSFYPQTASDLTSKWVGESEASVVRLFARARDNAPSIIFIDEIDAVGAARSEMGSSYLDRTLTQLLTELDGMTEQRGVFVMAATNRPDALDPALTRGGRLSRTIEIPLPDRAQRHRLLALFTREIPLVDVDLDALADRTAGLAGADLEALCQQAALFAMVSARERPGTPHGVDATAFAQALAARQPAGTDDDDDRGAEDSRPGGYL